MPYEVSTPVFAGPFDLLLHLILQEKVDLYEVSLSAIVDAYLVELRRIQDSLDLDVATEFLLIAATLVELKARRLLPGREDMDLDEELALWEERDLLLARLLECKTFKDVAAVLAGLADGAALSYPPHRRSRRTFPGPRPGSARRAQPHQAAQRLPARHRPKLVSRVLLDHVAPIP